MGILSGKEGGPAGSADGVGDERVGETGAFGSDAVEVGCFVDLRAIGGNGVLGVVVREDEDDVGFLCGERVGREG